MIKLLKKYLQSFVGVFKYHPPEKQIVNQNLKNILSLLDDVYLMTDANRAKVHAFDFKYNLHRCLIQLFKSNLLKQINFDALMNVLNNDYTGKQVAQLADALQYFKVERLLNQSYFNLMLKHASYAEKLASGLIALHKANVQNEEYKNLLIMHSKEADQLAKMIILLLKNSLMETSIKKLLFDETQKSIEGIELFFTLPHVLYTIGNLRKVMRCLSYTKDLKRKFDLERPKTQRQFDEILFDVQSQSFSFAKQTEIV